MTGHTPWSEVRDRPRYVDRDHRVFVVPFHNGVKRQWRVYVGRPDGGNRLLGHVYETVHRRYRVNQVDLAGRVDADWFTSCRSVSCAAMRVYWGRAEEDL